MWHEELYLMLCIYRFQLVDGQVDMVIFDVKLGIKVSFKTLW